MPNVDRLKRQMLREAVRENLDVIECRPPAPRRDDRWARLSVPSSTATCTVRARRMRAPSAGREIR